MLRLTRQPGAVACAAAVVVLAVRVLFSFGCVTCLLKISTNNDIKVLINEIVNEVHRINTVPSEIGYAVAAAWVIQAVGGRWRPAASWIDRMGRTLGLFWVATIPFGRFTFCFSY